MLDRRNVDELKEHLVVVNRLRSSCKNEMAPYSELSVFVIMAPGPALELCSFITLLRLPMCFFHKRAPAPDVFFS